MTRTLRRNVYGLQDHGYRVTDESKNLVTMEPDPLAPVYYPALYWVDHLFESSSSVNLNSDLSDGGTVDRFLRRNFLCWLEALCFFKTITDGKASIEKLIRLLQVCLGIQVQFDHNDLF